MRTWALLVGLLLMSSSAAADLKESWYMFRGRANMKIGNYRAAIEAFEKVCEGNPNHREAMRTLGIAYEKQGLTDKAITQFDRYLERFPNDPDIAFRLADILSWSRYRYRREDAIRYFRLGLRYRNDPRMRHRLARLLARDKKNLDIAVREYQLLLKDEPNNPTARVEYRKLLLWDERYRAVAIGELQRYHTKNPHDRTSAHQLARLLASRGDDNEARRLYKELVTARPANRQIRLEYADLLSRSPDHRQEAMVQYDRLLRDNPERRVRIARADLLAADPESRTVALQEYRDLVQQAPQDTLTRLKYADLLLAKKSTSRAAITHYQAVLRHKPRNAAAHRGLARAYAWNDDKDRALYHAQQARKIGGKAAQDITMLHRKLRYGREPSTGVRLETLYQPGDHFGLQGFSLIAHGRLEPVPHATLHAEAGYDQYWNRQQDISGVLLRAGGTYRFSSHRQLGAKIGYRSLGGNAPALLFQVDFRAPVGSWLLEVGAYREPRWDSLVALAGADAAGTDTTSAMIGAARTNALYADARGRLGLLELHGRGQLGFISCASALNNLWASLRGEAVYHTGWVPVGLEVKMIYATEFAHYASDHSAFTPSSAEPLPGGYFSPSFYMNHALRIRLQRKWGREHRVFVEAGPALQLHVDSQTSRTFSVGGLGWVIYQAHLDTSWRLRLSVGIVRMANVYTRFDFVFGAAYLF